MNTRRARKSPRPPSSPEGLRSNAVKESDWRPMHALVLIGFMAMATFVPVFRLWPLVWLGPLVGYATVVMLLKPLRASFRPWHFGRVNSHTVAATTIIAVGSTAALVAFHLLRHPDVHGFSRFLPVTALGGVIVAGVLFSIFNALFEELIFRGILFDAIESQWGAWMAIVTTALLFGYGHMRGYPPGPLGAVLAGLFGLCLGWLRVFSRGLGLPVLAHIAADATIFILIAHSGSL